MAPAAPQSPSEPFFCSYNHKYNFERTSHALEKLHERLEKRGLAHLVPLMAMWFGYYKQPYSWFYILAKEREIKGIPKAVGYLQYLAATHASGPGDAAQDAVFQGMPSGGAQTMLCDTVK